MSVIKIQDLPPIAHHMQKIILAGMIENHHRKVTHGQNIDPALAREHAITFTMDPKSDGERKLVEESYRITIRLVMAMDDLGLKHDKRNITVDSLVFMGLPRGGRAPLNG